MYSKPKIIRTATIAASLDVLLKGQLAFLSNCADVVAVSGADQHLKTVEEREKVRTADVAMERGIRPFKDLKSLLRLYRLFKKEKPDIVHSITPKAGLLSMLAAKMAGVPLRIHTFTGLIFPTKTGKMQKLLIFMDRLLCKAATHIIPEGQGVKNDLIAYGITQKPLEILANGNVNGIDVDYFDKKALNPNELEKLKSDLKIQHDDFVFVFIGRLVGDKGINELVAAFDQVQKAHPNTKLLLVGPEEEEIDPLLPETIALIHSHPNIISVGLQRDVRPYLAISHAMAFASYREGFPNSVMQAGAMELPAVVTDINGCNEIIVHGKNGLIVPVKNSSAMRDGMMALITDQRLYDRLKNNAREMITTRYEQSLVWEAVLKFYEKNSILKK